MPFDLSTQVAAYLGITVEQLGVYGLALLALCSWLLMARPRVRAAMASAGAWCEGKRKAAALTVTPVDDYAASFAAGVVWLASALFEAVLFILLALAELTRAIPAAMERAREAKAGASRPSADDGPPTRPLRKVPRGPLGVLTLCILLAGALVTTSGCATGRGSDTTPLHRASTAASVLVDTGTFIAGELEREIREETTEVFEACLAAAEPGRNCGLVAAARANEYRILSAAHNAYAEAVDNFVQEVAEAARRAESGEESELRDAIRMGARALATYDTLAELLQLAGIPAPPLPEGVRLAVEALH